MQHKHPYCPCNETHGTRKIHLNSSRYVMVKKRLLGVCSTSSRQKIPKFVKDRAVMRKFSLFHQPVVASQLIILAIISIACSAQKKTYETKILQMGQTRRLSVQFYTALQNLKTMNVVKLFAFCRNICCTALSH